MKFIKNKLLIKILLILFFCNKICGMESNQEQNISESKLLESKHSITNIQKEEKINSQKFIIQPESIHKPIKLLLPEAKLDLCEKFLKEILYYIYNEKIDNLPAFLFTNPVNIISTKENIKNLTDKKYVCFSLLNGNDRIMIRIFNLEYLILYCFFKNPIEKNFFYIYLIDCRQPKIDKYKISTENLIIKYRNIITFLINYLFLKYNDQYKDDLLLLNSLLKQLEKEFEQWKIIPDQNNSEQITLFFKQFLTMLKKQ